MLHDEVVEAVAIGNLKSIAEQPAMVSNLAFSNFTANTDLAQKSAVSNQQAMNGLGLSIVAKASNTVSNLGPLEARSEVDVLTNNGVAQAIADLKSAIEAFAGPQGGDGPVVWSKVVKALLKLGVYLDEAGHLIVPKGVPVIRIPGNFTREDVRVRADQNGLVIEIKAS
ncbi:hypothetical protein [[Pseudomonas] boreopolis]|uniref:hypothetical protein n=1 Tax=Xanthomonas boreopolis TaxID=86183 RepID=UPI003D9BF32A